MACDVVQPTGFCYLVALDESGSMRAEPLRGQPEWATRRPPSHRLRRRRRDLVDHHPDGAQLLKRSVRGDRWVGGVLGRRGSDRARRAYQMSGIST